MSVFEAGIRKFYKALSEVAREKGYFLDFEREEAYPCNSEGLKDEGRIYQVWENETPPRDFYFNYFLKDSDELDDTIKRLMRKGYVIKYNFHEADVTLGNVVVKIGGKWFAFGDCEQSVLAPREARAVRCGARTTAIWPMKWVLSHMAQAEVELRYAHEHGQHEYFLNLEQEEG
jgi:hypothetical protein